MHVLIIFTLISQILQYSIRLDWWYEFKLWSDIEELLRIPSFVCCSLELSTESLSLFLSFYFTSSFLPKWAQPCRRYAEFQGVCAFRKTCWLTRASVPVWRIWRRCSRLDSETARFRFLLSTFFWFFRLTDSVLGRVILRSNIRHTGTEARINQRVFLNS